MRMRLVVTKLELFEPLQEIGVVALAVSFISIICGYFCFIRCHMSQKFPKVAKKSFKSNFLCKP